MPFEAEAEGCELTLPALAAGVTIALPLQYSAPTTVAPEKFGEPGTPVSFGEVLPASGAVLLLRRPVSTGTLSNTGRIVAVT